MDAQEIPPQPQLSPRLLEAREAVRLAGNAMIVGADGIVPRVQSDHFNSCLDAVRDLSVELKAEEDEAKAIAFAINDTLRKADWDRKRDEEAAVDLRRMIASAEWAARGQRQQAIVVLVVCAILVIVIGVLLRIGWNLVG